MPARLQYAIKQADAIPSANRPQHSKPMPALAESAILAIIQGITEFLPVSSSAHLALGENLFGWEDRGVGFEIAVHVGTLFALVILFRRELLSIAKGVWRLLHGEITPQGRLALALVIASLPLLPAGWLLLQTDWRVFFHALEPIAWVNLAFALLLWLADARGARTGALPRLPLPHGLAIGVAQTLALIPGVSRAGITITMARALGYGRVDAARFSMLLGIPAILASTAALLTEHAMPQAADIPMLLFATALAFCTAAAVIALFLRMMARFSLLAFVYYRIALSVVLLAVVYLYSL